MSLTSWIIVALVGGILGKLLHPGDDGNGLFKTIIVGILGGWLGNFLAGHLLHTTMTGINLPSVGIAAGGSLIVLFIWRAWQQRKK